MGIDICSNGWRRLENLLHLAQVQGCGAGELLAPKLGYVDARKRGTTATAPLEDDDDDEGSF